MAQAAQRRGAIRAAICAALGAIACAGLLVLRDDARDPPATRSLVQRDRGDEDVRARAASEPSLTSSSTNSPDALAELIVALGDADANVRVDAVSDLGLLSDARAEWLLAVTAMQDPSPAVRVEALHALESLRAESQLAAFRHALDDPDKDVRKAAINALAELEGNASMELLSVALSDRDPAIAAAAAQALADFRSAR